MTFQNEQAVGTAIPGADANSALADGRHGFGHALHRRDDGVIACELSLAARHPPPAGNPGPCRGGYSIHQPNAEQTAAVSTDDVARRASSGPSVGTDSLHADVCDAAYWLGHAVGR